MGPYWLQVLSREASSEAALQDSFPKSPTPAVGGVAEVCPSPWFSPGRIDGDRSLGVLNYSDELAFWHLQAAGNTAALGDMTAFWQDQSSRYIPAEISAETTSERLIKEGFSGLRRQQLRPLGHHPLGHHRLGHHRLLCDAGHRDCHPEIRRRYPLRIESCRHRESSLADH